MRSTGTRDSSYRRGDQVSFELRDQLLQCLPHCVATLADSLRPRFVIVLFGPQAVTQQLGSNSRRVLHSKIDQQLHRLFLRLTGLWPDNLPVIDKLTSAKESASEPGPWLGRGRPQLSSRKTVC